MAFFEYLKFDGIALPLPDSYDVSLSAVEADSMLWSSIFVTLVAKKIS